MARATRDGVSAPPRDGNTTRRSTEGYKTGVPHVGVAHATVPVAASTRAMPKHLVSTICAGMNSACPSGDSWTCEHKRGTR